MANAKVTMSPKLALSMKRQLVDKVRGGFILETPTTQHFQSNSLFREALVAQRNAVVMLDFQELKIKEVGIEGEVVGTDYKLSHAAFGDLCNFTKTPVSFIKDLAVCDEQLALDVLRSRIQARMEHGKPKAVIVDTRCNRVEGIVGADTYKPIANVDLFDWTMDANGHNPASQLDFSNGWIDGPYMRMTAVNSLKPVEPRKGDVVRLGTSVENAIHGDLSVKVRTYCERLVCTNGMTRRDKEHTATLIHTGDIEFDVSKALVQSAGLAATFAPLMATSATKFLGPDNIKAIRQFISNPRNGGNATLEARIIRGAMNEAQNEGRDAEAVTLWNFTNAVTAAAHEAKSLQRRVELEQMGFELMNTFVGAAQS